MNQKNSNMRFASLDLFRALMILTFIFFNLLETFVYQENIPSILKHNQGAILLLVDLIAPAFAFIIGAALFFSYKNQLSNQTENFFQGN